jgi:hypothetical protein
MDGRVRLIDLATRKPRAVVLAHKGGVWDMGLSADGKRFITGGPDKLVRLWDLAKVKEFQTYDKHAKGVSAVALSPDGPLAASGDYAGLVHVWEVATGKKRFEKRGSTLRMSALAFSPDGSQLAGGGLEPANYRSFIGSTRATQLHVWTLANGAARILPDRASRIAFTPDGNLAGAGFYLDFRRGPTGGTYGDGHSYAVLCDLSGKRRFRVDEHWSGMALSADGRYMATGWGSRRHMGGIVTSGSPEGIHLWEVATGQQVWVQRMQEADAAVMTLTRDSSTLIAGTQRGTWHYHDLRPPDWEEPATWKDADYDRAWQLLAGSDAVKAYAAVWDLSSRGNEAVAWLRKQVKPIAVPGERIKRLLADLENAKPSLDRLRAGRLLSVLERIGTREARVLLDELAKGAPGAYMTEEARRASGRVAMRIGR